MTQTKAGRDPEGAEKDIAAQAQQPAALQGDLETWRELMEVIFDDMGLPENAMIRYHLAAMPQAQPAAPQSDLAAWQKEHDSALVMGVSRPHLRDHLATMPQAQPDAELLELVGGARNQLHHAADYLDRTSTTVAKGTDHYLYAEALRNHAAVMDAAIAQAETGAPA